MQDIESSVYLNIFFEKVAYLIHNVFHLWYSASVTYICNTTVITNRNELKTTKTRPKLQGFLTGPYLISRWA